MLGEVALRKYRGLDPTAPTWPLERRHSQPFNCDNAGRGAVRTQEGAVFKSIKAGNEQNVV